MSEHSLPWLLLDVEVTLSNTQLKEQIISILQSQNCVLFPTDLSTSNLLTFVKKERNILKQVCGTLFGKKVQNIKISILMQFTENKYSRLMECRLLEGNIYDGESLIINFVKKCIHFSKNIRVVKHATGFFGKLNDEIVCEFALKNKNIDDYSKNISTIHNKNNNSQQSNVITTESTTMLENINKEASGYYEIYKILSKENYDVGKNVSIFISDFKISNENIEKSCQNLPKQMNEIIKIINTCDNTFNNYFNLGKNDLTKNSKLAIEKYIFNKVYFQLFELYNKKYEKLNQDFVAKKSRILSEYSVNEIMDILEIKKDFRCLDDYENSEHSNYFLPYKSAIDFINKIEFEQNPKSKFDTLIEAGLELRNTLLGANNSRKELNSMDDELPIFIYCVINISLKNAPAEFNLIQDYLQAACPEVFESKVLTNVIGAVYYIVNSWEFEKKEDVKEEVKEEDINDDNIQNDDNIGETENNENKN